MKKAFQGDEWTEEDDEYLQQLAAENTPTRVMALKLDRSVDAVRSHAAHLGLSLKPTNQSPFG